MKLEEVLAYAGPLAGDNPAGADVQHDEDYSILDEEIRKGEGIDIQPIDWLRVEVLAGKILEEQSKDLRVAARLTAALFNRHSFEGLAVGLQLITAMVQADYWDQIYPQRRKNPNKARAAAVEWAIKKLERPFSEYETTLEDAPEVVNAAKAFSAMDSALAERMGDSAPNIFECRNVINRFRQEAEYLLQEQQKQQAEAVKAAEPKPEPKPEPAAAVAEKAVAQPQAKESVAVATTAAAPAPQHKPVAVTSPADIEKALRSCNSTVSKIGAMVRGQNLTDPYSYYMVRVSAWMLFREPPPDGVLPPPSSNKIAALQQLEQSKDWPALIEECEKTFASGQVCWLGLHRFAANALEAISATDAARAVKDAVIHLNSRLPEFAQRTFADGSGFADEMTKGWIASLAPQSESGAAVPVGDNAANGWDLAASEAKQLAISGEFDKGLELFRAGVQGVCSLREQAHWQLEQARFCFDAGHLEVAMPQLSHLHQLLNKQNLDQWEPELNLEVVRLLLRCHSKQQTKKKYTAEQLTQVESLKAHLCLKDPLGALSVINN